MSRLHYPVTDDDDYDGDDAFLNGSPSVGRTDGNLKMQSRSVLFCPFEFAHKCICFALASTLADRLHSGVKLPQEET